MTLALFSWCENPRHEALTVSMRPSKSLPFSRFLFGTVLIGNVYSQGGFLALTNGGMNDFSNPYLGEKYGLEAGISLIGSGMRRPNAFAELGGVFEAGFTQNDKPIWGGGGLVSIGVSYNQGDIGKFPSVLYSLSLNEYMLVQKWTPKKEIDPGSYVLDYIAVSGISFDISIEVKSEVFVGFKVGRSLFEGVTRANRTKEAIPAPEQAEPWRMGIKVSSPFLFHGV